MTCGHSHFLSKLISRLIIIATNLKIELFYVKIKKLYIIKNSGKGLDFQKKI